MNVIVEDSASNIIKTMVDVVSAEILGTRYIVFQLMFQKARSFYSSHVFFRNFKTTYLFGRVANKNVGLISKEVKDHEAPGGLFANGIITKVYKQVKLKFQIKISNFQVNYLISK